MICGPANGLLELALENAPKGLMSFHSSPLHRRVLRAIRRHAMFTAGNRVGVAVSGGADSVALLHLLDDVREELGLRLVVLHCNHQLRGAEADADERFVEELASRLELEFFVTRKDVRALAAKEHRNLEETARRWRLSIFGSLVEAGRVDRVALGHTADDQAETVLLRVLRGAGTRGLAGIYPVWQGILVRPLLEVRRAELRQFLIRRGQAWREDTTNLDLRIARNRIRQELLPQLETYSPGIVTRLRELAERSRAEETFWRVLEDSLLSQLAIRQGSSVRIPAAALTAPPLALARALPPAAQLALARRLVRRIVEEVKGDLRQLTGKHIDEVLRFVARPSSGHRLFLPGGIVLTRSFDQLAFQPKGAAERSGSIAYCYPVQLPGHVAVREIGQQFCFNLVDREVLGRRYNSEPPALDRNRIGDELVVRNWHPGDAYQPQGSRRSKKVKELFQARKIPAAERGGWPVVLSGSEIVWVRGFPVAARCGLSDSTQVAIVIEEKPI